MTDSVVVTKPDIIVDMYSPVVARQPITINTLLNVPISHHMMRYFKDFTNIMLVFTTLVCMVGFDFSIPRIKGDTQLVFLIIVIGAGFINFVLKLMFVIQALYYKFEIFLILNFSNLVYILFCQMIGYWVMCIIHHQPPVIITWYNYLIGLSITFLPLFFTISPGARL